MAIICKATDAAGYKRIHEYGEWCVAMIHFSDHLRSATQERLERHLRTDEAFVLLSGSATLYEGIDLYPTMMALEVLYIIPEGIWHTITLEPESKVLVIENRSTGPENTQYYKNIIKKVAT